MWNPFAKSNDPPPPPTQVNPASGPAEPAPSSPPPVVPAAGPAAPAPTAAVAPSAGPAAPAPLPLNSAAKIASVEMMGEIAVATLCATELTQEIGASQLSELLLELAETGARHFVLDVESLQFMDSACLGCLVEALNQLSARGGSIALANSNHSVHYIFSLTRLDRVFMICKDVMSAIDAVERASKAA